MGKQFGETPNQRNEPKPETMHKSCKPMENPTLKSPGDSVHVHYKDKDEDD